MSAARRRVVLAEARHRELAALEDEVEDLQYRLKARGTPVDRAGGVLMCAEGELRAWGVGRTPDPECYGFDTLGPVC